MASLPMRPPKFCPKHCCADVKRFGRYSGSVTRCKCFEHRFGPLHIPLGVHGLNANLRCTRIEVLLKTSLNGRLTATHHHSIEEALTTAILQLCFRKAVAQPIVAVVR